MTGDLRERVKTAIETVECTHDQTPDGAIGWDCSECVTTAVLAVTPELERPRAELVKSDAAIERLSYEGTEARINQREAEAELAEWNTAKRHQAFTHCAQNIGHVTMAAFGEKIAEKVQMKAERDQTVREVERLKAELAETIKVIKWVTDERNDIIVERDEARAERDALQTEARQP